MLKNVRLFLFFNAVLIYFLAFMSHRIVSASFICHKNCVREANFDVTLV